MDAEFNIKHIYARMREMQAEIDFLKSLVCQLEDGVTCECEKCWGNKKYKELGGEEFMFDWKMEELNSKVKKAWIIEKRKRLEKYVDNAVNMRTL